MTEIHIFLQFLSLISPEVLGKWALLIRLFKTFVLFFILSFSFFHSSFYFINVWNKQIKNAHLPKVHRDTYIFFYPFTTKNHYSECSREKPSVPERNREFRREIKSSGEIWTTSLILSETSDFCPSREDAIGVARGYGSRISDSRCTVHTKGLKSLILMLIK